MENKKIVIVDHEPNSVLPLDYLVQRKGYQPFIARNGSEVIAIAYAEIPDFIVLDIMMPDSDGYEVCKTVKSDLLFTATKTIFLSAKTKKEGIDRGLAMGANRYVTKPFSTKQLMQEITEQVTI
jgi:DNA-binding response OmpR family regulator